MGLGPTEVAILAATFVVVLVLIGIAGPAFAPVWLISAVSQGDPTVTVVGLLLGGFVVLALDSVSKARAKRSEGSDPGVVRPG